MSRKLPLAVVALGVFAFLFLVAMGSSAEAQNKCAGSKIKAALKKAKCKGDLEAKQASYGGTVDSGKVQKCEAKFSSTFAKLEAKGGCATPGDASAIEAKVDAFIVDLDGELVPPTTPTTTSTTTTTLMAGCCPAEQMVIVTSPGTFVEDGLPTFPFPGGMTITLQVGAPDGTCKHPASIPPAGFTAPVFCQPGLGFSTRYDAIGCASGPADGQGTVWDPSAPACPDPEVIKVGDTSDGVCNPAAQPCNSTPGGAGANTLGDIDTTRGDGACDSTGRHAQLDIPLQATTWLNGDFDGCPDPDGAFDGADTLITQRSFILSPTTDLASAAYVDKNFDGCKRSGAGPDGPVTATGAPAAGPCCVVGQAMTLATAGADFQGTGPLFDILYRHTIPSTVAACLPPAALSACTLTADPCFD